VAQVQGARRRRRVRLRSLCGFRPQDRRRIGGVGWVRAWPDADSVVDMTKKKDDQASDQSDSEDASVQYTRIDSPDLPGDSITVDMGIDDLVDFVKKGIEEHGTWTMPAADDPEGQTLINVGALRWLTLTPVEADVSSDDVLHLNPES
jgi:hypothetical protein